MIVYDLVIIPSDTPYTELSIILQTGALIPSGVYGVGASGQ